MPAEARAVTASAVISPLNSEIAVDVALRASRTRCRLTVVAALAVVDVGRDDRAVRGIGELRRPPGCRPAATTIDVVDAPAWFGTETLIAHAVAAAPGVRAGPSAPAEPKTRSVSGMQQGEAAVHRP